MDLSLATPWGLLGLLALPLIWWLQKRLRRPPDVELPSLMFLLDEEDARSLPRGRLVDAELLLALAAAGLIALAAADPVIRRTAPEAVVRVVISGGSPAGRSGYPADVETTLAALRDAVDEGTVVETVWVPAPPVPGRPQARPEDGDLVASALAGAASARFELSDADAPADPAGARWLVLGRPEATNTGIVAVSVERAAEGLALFVTLSHHGRAEARGRLVAVGPGGEHGVRFRIASDGFASLTLPLGAEAEAPLRVVLRREDGSAWGDDLAADDAVRLERGPLRVGIDDALPPALRARIRRGLTAVLGREGFVEHPAPVLVFPAPSVALTPEPDVRLYVGFVSLAKDAPTVTAPAGPMRVHPDPLVRDLASAGGTWVYDAGLKPIDERASPPEMLGRILLGVADGERTWPVLSRFDSIVSFFPDPLRGSPAVVDTPFWPLFLQNVVEASGHRGVGEGWRAVGLLDARSSRASRTRDSLDVASVRGLAPTRPGDSRSLRTLLIACALLCLALLWAAPRIRRQFARRARALRASPRAHA